ncbi:MAG: DUF72 domain-containing protein [Acidobacteriota bacterium]
MTGYIKDRFAIPARYAPYLRVGTCSWKFDSWKGLLYGEGKDYRSDDYLSDYARHLNSVEVDQWFWSLYPGGVRLPEMRVVRQYADAVPDDFVFTVKAPNALTLTHFYAKQPAAYAAHAGKPNSHFLSQDLLRQFLERLAPLGRKLGPIMFQFEYLNREKMPSGEAFSERLQEFIGRAPQGFQYAVETRNPNYLGPAFLDCLRGLRLGFVYLEGYYMPPIKEVFAKYDPLTADFSIIRLHGGDRQEIERQSGGVWDRLITPKPESVRAAVDIVRANARRRSLTYVNVNNHLEGSAPLTILRLLQALRGEEEAP